MRNSHFLKLIYGLMLVMLSTAFVSCVDDNEDTEAPFLNISLTTLNFEESNGQPVEGGQDAFEISTNRKWRIVITEEDKKWVTLSQYEGEGSARIQVSVPGGEAREANIVVEMFNKVGPLMSETLTIKRGQIVPATLIYKETFGTKGEKDPNTNKYPFVDQYDGWEKSGEGSATVTYKGSGASLRKSGKLSEGYEGASGLTKLFFGANASFEVQKITLKESQTNLRLTFGGNYSKNNNGTYDNEFKPEKFHFYLSADGEKWSAAVPYEIKKANEFWVFATANFTLSKATATLYIKFAADEASVFSIDDVTLVTGNGGTPIDLSEGGEPEPPVPGEPKAITIPELIAMMTPSQTVIDASADRFFEAVVQNDVEGGNYSNNNLILATENSQDPQNGITLYGNQVEPSGDLKLAKGDKVKVTLYKGLAKVVNYKGMYEVTGGATDTWVKVEKTGTATITPFAITPDKLTDYQGMTVTIEKATPKAAGVWGVKSPHTFTAAGKEFAVFCKKDAKAFVGQPFTAVEGNITGIATVFKNNAQLSPRNMDDVKDFKAETSSPLITEVNPSILKFPSTGGAKTITVTTANQGENKLSASGLSGTLSATIDGNVVTVTATENKGDAVSQTLTISLESGNSKTISITQEAASPTSGNTITMTKESIVSGKTGSIELKTNNYGNQKVNDTSSWYTWIINGFNFTGAKIGIAEDKNGGGIQMQGNATDVSKQGRIDNTSVIADIQSIELVLKVATSSKYDPSYSLYAGTTVHPSKETGSKIEAISEKKIEGKFKIYTQKFDLSKGNYSYFSIMNDLTGALYIDSIKIVYKK
ncbi:DUF5689 domain-containing protein [Bacteroides pyogenes]|uniref:BACON domain-containing protein n=1 Tax=Bacteroides pyogenes TaxID=310300 RepID=A0A5D3FKU8_9BACE|nr:DUF5689 domain-containing protein [Bacteroides pyogenes]TYK33361.1 BACON domain-containing protein [Bacteroides pyogenes]TYK48526.1 BACON domain-containing protein [Bacteroides pyogenes]